MPGATVTFAPQDGQPTAFGTTDNQGNFKLTTYDFQDGAAAGKYKVVISKTAAASMSEAAASDDADHEAAEASASEHSAGSKSEATSLVPPQYTTAGQTPLSAEVTESGENVFQFEVK